MVSVHVDFPASPDWDVSSRASPTWLKDLFSCMKRTTCLMSFIDPADAMAVEMAASGNRHNGG
jgi:hypothetical protein